MYRATAQQFEHAPGKGARKRAARMSSKEQQQNISQADVEQALRRFRERGGIIRKLPEQKHVSVRRVISRSGFSALNSDL